MAVVAISDSILTDIADAIRSKNGQETLYKPSEMPDAIEAISGGGITPTGTISITENGTHDVTSYASANVNVSGGVTPTGTKEISITSNGTTTEDVTNYASAQITANVPNSYSSGDEGKVVSNGALVAQTSDTVTTNDTYDTTLINNLTVNVSGGGSSMATGKYTPTQRQAQHIIDTGLSSVTAFVIVNTGTLDFTTGMGICAGVAMLGNTWFNSTSGTTGSAINAGNYNSVGSIQNGQTGVQSNVDGVITLNAGGSFSNNSRALQPSVEYTWYAC